MGKIGVFLLVLVLAFTWGNLWFHLVEALIRWIRKSLQSHKEQPAWHTFPIDKEETDDD